MALVRGVEASKSRQAITRGMVRICQEMGVQIIAEGIETAAERYFFLHEGVTLMQGYPFAEPAFQAIALVGATARPVPALVIVQSGGVVQCARRGSNSVTPEKQP